MTKPTDDTLRQRLLSERPGISGPELSLGGLSEDLVFLRSDWVSTWEDTRNVVLFDDGGTSATRAITRQGRLIWLVRSSNYRRPYHARASTAAAAHLEAQIARRRRAEFRNLREKVRRIVRELRFPKVRHDVTVDDAYASALCEEGVDGFLRTLRLGRYRHFPGWLIAWLYVFDRQIGHVLYQARQRHEASARNPTDETPASRRERKTGLGHRFPSN